MMTNTAREREAGLLDALIQHYEGQGFEVFVDPSPHMLPAFLGGYRPDALAIKPDIKIAIEIKRSSPADKERFNQLAKLFEEHPGWELRFYYSEPQSPQTKLEIVPLDAIQRAVQMVKAMRTNRQYLPALLTACSTLEALGRVFLPDDMARPQEPIRLVELLASEGWLTPLEADVWRHAVSLRNAAAHGQLDAIIPEEELDKLIDALDRLAGLLGRRKRK
jgi:uncharacterized protein YutE (UPF0331/DUF86 family)